MDQGYKIYSIGLNPTRNVRSLFFKVEQDAINLRNYPVTNIQRLK